MHLTVVIITYDHEAFVGDAINGVLMQDADFPCRMVIIDDASSDGTARIIREFRDRHPDRIQAILLDENRNDNRAFIEAIRRCDGGFVSILDGDDFWISPEKARRQVAFLQAHPECVMCFHQAYNRYPGAIDRLYSEDVDYPFDRVVFSLDDILVQNFIPTSSVMFRSGVLSSVPQSYYDAPAADWLLYIQLARHGLIGYLDEAWTVRRIHPGGLISIKSDVECLALRIATMRLIDEYLDFACSKRIQAAVAAYERRIAQLVKESKVTASDDQQV